MKAGWAAGGKQIEHKVLIAARHNINFVVRLCKSWVPGGEKYFQKVIIIPTNKLLDITSAWTVETFWECPLPCLFFRAILAI